MTLIDRPPGDVTTRVVQDALVLVTAGDSERDAVRYAVSQAGRGWVDGDVLARALRDARRPGARLSPQHHRDYTGHLLREAPLVCRHVKGDPQYWVHVEAECSPTCQQAQNPRPKHEPAYGRCQSCNLELPASGECDLCG